MITNKLEIVNFDYFKDYGIENSFSILAELEKKISKYRDGECEEIEAIKIGNERYVFFDFVQYIQSSNQLEQNKYVYEFSGTY
jgi:hypothetical protein